MGRKLVIKADSLIPPEENIATSLFRKTPFLFKDIHNFDFA